MSSKLVTGLLVGAAAGAILGILFAPDKGSDTRKKIAKKSGDITDSVKDSFNNFIDGVKETYSGAKEDVEEFGDKVKSKVMSAKNDGKSAFS